MPFEEEMSTRQSIAIFVKKFLHFSHPQVVVRDAESAFFMVTREDAASTIGR